MYQVILDTDSRDEFNAYKDIVLMLRTAKAHGYARLTIEVKEGKMVFGSVELKTKWENT